MMKKLVLIAVFVLMAGSGVAAQTCSIKSYFVSPDVDGVIETAIIQAIDGARKSLDIALFSFTDDQLGVAVVRAARRGVTVRVILGVDQDKMFGGEYEKLVSAGIPVVVVGPPGLFHHKFALIDGTLVITGSYDWSDTADKDNYENVVFIYCSAPTVNLTVPERYAMEFNRLWEELRSVAGSTSGEPALSTAVHPVIIHTVDRIGECCIELLNISAAPVDIGGWSISDLEGSYSFPPDTLINPDEPYQVCIDTYNPTLDGQGLYLDDEDEVFLMTPEGEIIDEVVWKSTPD